MPNFDRPTNGGDGGSDAVEFFAALLIPTVVDSDNKPKPAKDINNNTDDPDVRALLDDGALLMLPNEVETETSGWIGGSVEEVQLIVPATLIWNSNVSDEDFGEIGVGIEFGVSVVGEGDRPLRTNRGMQDLTLRVNYEPPSAGGAINYWRPSGIDFYVHFFDGLLKESAPSERLEADVKYVVPNYEASAKVSELLGTTAEIYATFKDSANRLTRSNVNVLDRAAREITYWQAKGAGIEDDETNILNASRRDGISGFKDAIQDVPVSGIGELKTMLSGPSVYFRS